MPDESTIEDQPEISQEQISAPVADPVLRLPNYVVTYDGGNVSASDSLAELSLEEFQARTAMLAKVRDETLAALKQTARAQELLYPYDQAEETARRQKENLLGYYESLKRSRAERAERIAAAADSDLPANIKKLLTQRAPIDAAMERVTKRNSRPRRSVRTAE